MLSRLYAIADRETLTARDVSLRVFAEGLRGAGIKLLQYRDKNSSDEDVLRSARELDEVFAGTDTILILNDRVELAAELGWGVHVGQGDMSVEDVRRVLAQLDPHRQQQEAPHPFAKNAKGWATRIVEGNQRSSELIVGVSTHGPEQVAEAAMSAADYVAIGPVFVTATKANPEPVVGLEGVQRARVLTVKPLVAIGGITLANARAVLDAGADSVAVIGGLFVPGRPVRDVAGDFLALLR
ncbi:MAG TPA: thiamine phosphate synthase [Acidobacteriaceae bacterium]|jgi:thiamine-phosphate pyrophosphorylase